MAILMSSSKAISISRRKFKLLVILLLLPVFLWAEPYRAAIVTDNPGYQGVLEDALLLLSGDVTSQTAIEARREKDERLKKIEREKSISQARQDEKSPSENAETAAEEETLSLELVTLELSDTEKEFLYKGDSDATRYVLLRDNLDLLLVSDAAEDGMLTEAVLYINGEESRRTLYITGEDGDEFSAVVALLKPLLKDDDTIIIRADLPYAVSVSVDGNTEVPVRGYIAAERGEHSISYSSPGFESLSQDIEVGDDTVLTAALIERPVSSLFISSRPYDSELFINGMKLDSHTLPEAPLPFQVTARHDGFGTYTIQSRMDLDKLEISLRPEWMENEDIVKDAKDRFYRNLLTTLVSFGCYVASGSLEDIYPEAEFSPVTGMLAGFSFVGLVELFDSMFDYFQAARLGI